MRDIEVQIEEERRFGEKDYLGRKKNEIKNIIANPYLF